MTRLRDTLAGLDTMRESVQDFSLQDVVDQIGASRSTLTSILPSLVNKGSLSVIKDSKPYRYKFTNSKPLVNCFDDGSLKDLWVRSNANKGYNKVVEKPPEEIEIDPIELLEQLNDQDFGLLIASYVARKNAEIDPLKDEIKDLQSRVMISTSNYDTETSKLRHDVDALRRELRDEREKIIHLRNELQSANNKLVRKEPPVKLVMVDRHPVNNKEHGSTSNTRSTIVVHKKPLTGHAPSSVTSRKEDS